jgi:hypothetical protein
MKMNKSNKKKMLVPRQFYNFGINACNIIALFESQWNINLYLSWRYESPKANLV